MIADGVAIGRRSEPVDSGLAMINQALYDEFVRLTGCTTRASFSEWVAHLRASLCCDHRARVVWELLSPSEQSAMLLGHAKASPPAEWPSLDLAG